MKSLSLACLFLITLTTALVANVPALPATEAAAIAQTDLVTRGLESTAFIAEIVYKKQSLANGEEHWEVLWSKDLPAQTEGRREIGIRIKMDRSYTRSVR